jgi:hypothetical protein
MIRCILELLPGGIDDPELNEHLGAIHISNDIFRSMDDPRRGTYNFDLYKKRVGIAPWTEGRIENFPRYSYHPWNLVRQILNLVADEHGGRI